MVDVMSNEVWLSRSTDGINWGNEILIGYGSNPSIAVSGCYAYLVWQDINWLGGNGFDNVSIYMRCINLYNNTLGSLTLVDNFLPNIENFQANPVIDGNWLPDGSYDSKMIAWREPDGIKIKRYTSSYGWSSKATVTGTNSYSYNPSIANYNDAIYFVCWEDDAY